MSRRQEIEEAFEKYKWARDEASRTGDWSIWAACFTPDAHYIEHAYGEMRGRDEIETLRVFDAASQRSIENVESLNLMPARETPLTPEAIARFKRNWRLSFEGSPT